MTAAIRVLIVDDHEIVREGLETLLGEEPTIEVVGQAANGHTAVSLAGQLRPDIILMDLVMPEMDGLEAIRRIRHTGAGCGIIVLTSYADDRQVREAIEAGAIGYLMKDVLRADLLEAIHNGAAGKPTLHPQVQHSLMQQVVTPPVSPKFESLTRREREVLRLIAHGQSNKEIAASLYLTEGTIKGYVSAILAKLNVADRTQAALYAVKYGLVDLEGG